MTRIQRYTTYAKWDWMMNRRFYLTYGMAIAFGLFGLFLVCSINRIINTENAATMFTRDDMFVIFFMGFIYLSFFFVMAFCLHAYRTKQDRILTMGLPVEKGSKLLHHTLAIYAVTMVSVVVGIMMCDIVFQAAPIFFNVDTSGSICAECIHELNELFTISPSVAEWFRPYFIYHRIFMLLGLHAIPAAVMFVSSCKVNKFYISAIVACLYALIFTTFVDYIDSCVWYHRWRGEDHYAINLMLICMIVVSVIFIVVSIWGVRSFRKMQVTSRFMH